MAAGQDIDKIDKIDTNGFFIELGTAQVSKFMIIFSYLILEIVFTQFKKRTDNFFALIFH